MIHAAGQMLNPSALDWVMETAPWGVAAVLLIAAVLKPRRARRRRDRAS